MSRIHEEAKEEKELEQRNLGLETTHP